MKPDTCLRMRCCVAAALATLVVIAMSAVACSDADGDQAARLDPLITKWLVASRSLWLVPRSEVDSILAQATRWDARRDRAEAAGRRFWVNIVNPQSRPIKVDRKAWLTSLQPHLDQLDRVLAPRSSLRTQFPYADPAELMDEIEQWGLNNDLTTNRCDPQALSIEVGSETRVDSISVDRRYSDNRLGLTVHTWHGIIYSARRMDSWAQWQVIVVRSGEGWRIEDARNTGTNGENDPHEYGPESFADPYRGFEMAVGEDSRLF